MNTEAIVKDFNRIATVADQYGSGSDRYDDFLCHRVPPEARSVADIGCGLGRLSLKLALDERTVTGIDLSPEMISRAQRNTSDKNNIVMICGDFLTDKRLHEYDCVVTAATLHHVDLDTGVQRLKDLVRKDGRLIIHDLRGNASTIEQVKALIFLLRSTLLRFVRTGNPLGPRAVRRAWDAHGANEKYLTISQVRKMTETHLPGARIYAHWGWRYTVVWDKLLN
jgi:2-polyprenyl-3-methyl-5-hydroxy-6-metoxy-1,4-benzoquinol methylase